MCIFLFHEFYEKIIIDAQYDDAIDFRIASIHFPLSKNRDS